MQTEIDKILAEQNSSLMQQNNLLAEQNQSLVEQNSLLAQQNSYLSQQISSLKVTVSTYSDLIETQKTLITELKMQISKLKQAGFSETLLKDYQKNLLAHLEAQSTTALNSLNLENIVIELVGKRVDPLLSKLEQMPVSQDFYKDIETLKEQVALLANTIESLKVLIKTLIS